MNTIQVSGRIDCGKSEIRVKDEKGFEQFEEFTSPDFLHVSDTERLELVGDPKTLPLPTVYRSLHS